MKIFSFRREQVKNSELMDEILRLDQDNMRPLFQKIGEKMPIDRRKLAFNFPGTVIVLRDDDMCLAGYLEYGPGWDDPSEIYLSSIQIASKYRNGIVLLLLMRHAMSAFSHGQIIRTHVQKNNETAIRIYKRLGFHIDESSEKNGTFSASMVYPTKWPNINGTR